MGEASRSQQIDSTAVRTAFLVRWESEPMMRQKTARSILHGIAIVGILSGMLLVFAAFGGLLEIEREDRTLLCGSLIISAVLLAMGASLARTSCLVLKHKHKAFKTIANGIAYSWPACIFLAAEPVHCWVDALPSRELRHYVRMSTILVSFLLYFLGVSVCKRLANGLVEAANVQPAEELAKSGDKHVCREGRES